LYLLFIPALKGDDGPAARQPPHLVRLTEEKGHTTIVRMYPDLYYRKYTGKKDVTRDRLKRGLAMKEARDSGEVTVNGAAFHDRGMGYYQVSLEGKEEEPNWWHGHAKVTIAPYYELAPAPFSSEWSMQPAPPSAVYERMVHAFIFLRRYGAGRETDSTVRTSGELPALRTKEDYLAFLRAEDPAWPKRRLVTISINAHFRALMADALEKGEMSIEDGEFAVSEALKRTFQGEEPLREIDINVTFEGESIKTERYDPRLEASRPPWIGRQIRFMAGEPPEEREEMLGYAGKTDRQRVEKLDFTWQELRYVPDAAFLAEHMASVPDDLKERIATGYIDDDSLDYFPGISFEELAAVPNPVLLVACLPHMEREQAEGLAQTERVRELLSASGLQIKEVADYSIPKLIAKVLAPMPVEQARALVARTPKFEDYLRATDNVELRKLIEEKGIELPDAPR